MVIATPGTKSRVAIGGSSKATASTVPAYMKHTTASSIRNYDDLEDRSTVHSQSRSISPSRTGPSTARSMSPGSTGRSKRSTFSPGSTRPQSTSPRSTGRSLRRSLGRTGSSQSAKDMSLSELRGWDLSVFEGCEDPTFKDLFDFKGCEDPTFADSEQMRRLTTKADLSYLPRTNNFFRSPSSVARFATNPDVAEFVNWVELVPHGWEYVHEIFLKESAKPQVGDRSFRGARPLPGLTREKFVRLLMDRRYPNEAGLDTIFDEVAKEKRTDGHGPPPVLPVRGRNHSSVPPAAEVEETIILPQFQRFERRVKTVNATLLPKDENSPASRFVNMITKKYGSTLLAWRTQIDKHETGRVGYSDFMNACRSMGMSAHGKLVWDNVKRNRTDPMELHDLDKKEADNLEKFAEVMWEKVGFDLTKAWQSMDVMNQNYLTLEQFTSCADFYGFEGDAKLLFKGLDDSGIGRLKEEGFKYISKISRIAQRHFGDGHQVSKGAMTDLVIWCKRQFGSPEALLRKLDVDRYDGQGIAVRDLAARLAALGFEGDALEVAHRAAQKEGGTMVTAESLHKFLSKNNRVADHQPEPPKPLRMGPSSHDRQWCGAVEDISAQNRQRCKYNRDYFESERMYAMNILVNPPEEAVDRPTNVEDARTSNRPRYYSTYDPMASPKNESRTATVRKYFQDTAEKPLRTSQRELLVERLAAKAVKDEAEAKNTKERRAASPPKRAAGDEAAHKHRVAQNMLKHLMGADHRNGTMW